MSLDVYLKVSEPVKKKSGSGIFVRKNGSTVEISRDEWDEMNPGVEPMRLNQEEEANIVYHSNITHNLAKMAHEANLFDYVWNPSKDILFARNLVAPLENGIALLKSDPERFKQFNPENGWGSYDTLISWLENYLEACYEYPDAVIEVSR